MESDHSSASATKQSGKKMSGDVDICFTCLTDKPPKLPLREELPSLGVEVIYKAQGVGSRASQHEARKAVQHYMYKQQAKDLKKRRMFPKSSQRIKSVLAQRRKMEKELKLPHALSYESYQRELLGDAYESDVDGKSKSSGTVSSATTKATSEAGNSLDLATNLAIQRGKSTVEKALHRLAFLRSRLAMGRNSNGAAALEADKTTAAAAATRDDQSKSGASSKTQSIADLLGEAGFADLLAPSRDENGMAAVYGSDRETAASSSVGSPSRDRASGRKGRDHFPNMEVKFVTSAVTQKHLPNLTTVDESDNDLMHPTTSIESGEYADTSVTGQQPGQQQTETIKLQYRIHRETSKDTNPGSDISVPISVEYNHDPHAGQRSQHTQRNAPEVSTYEVMSKFEQSYKDWMGASSNIFDKPPPPGAAALASVNADTSKEAFENIPDEAYWDGVEPSDQQHQVHTAVTGTVAAAAVTSTALVVAEKQTKYDITAPTTPIEDKRLVSLAPGIFDSVSEAIYSRTFSTVGSPQHRPDITYTMSTSMPNSPAASSVPNSPTASSVFTSNPVSPGQQSPGIPYAQSPTSEIQLSPNMFGGVAASSTAQGSRKVSGADQRRDPESTLRPVSPKGAPNKGSLLDQDSDGSTAEPASASNAEPSMDESTRSPVSPVQSKDESGLHRAESSVNESRNVEPTGTLSAPTSMSEDDAGLAWRALPRLPTGTSEQEELKVVAMASREGGGSEENKASTSNGPTSKQVYEAQSSPTNQDGNGPQKRIATEVGVVHVSRAKRIAMNRRARRRSESPKKRKGRMKENKKKESEHRFNWFATAKHALENVAAGMAVAASLVTDDKAEGSDSAKGKEQCSPGTESRLIQILNLPDAAISEIQSVLRKDKSLVRMRQPNGWFPLHVLCNRPMPDRSAAKEVHLTDHLVADIQVFIRQLDLVYTANPAACQAIDRDADLPVHLLARNLMRWETQWYETVYNQAAVEKNASGKAALAITRLYNLMSECIEMILRPLVESSPQLCREAGSVGKLLPLHIAAIFTASVHTQRLILEAYEDAATIPCDVSKLETFVPDGSLPIQLHDSLSTDFPKWETETTTDPLLKWSNSQSRKAGSSGLEDCIRRSDLLFAYNPNVDPYRFDKARIRRFESRIQFEAKFLLCEDRTTISRASERLWLWLCTFEDAKTQSARYVTSVKGIVESLPPKLVLMLATMPTTDGRSVLDDAHQMCAEVIRWRLKDHPVDSDQKVPLSITASRESLPNDTSIFPTKAPERVGPLTEKDHAEESVVKTLKAPFGGKNCIGFLCRTLFNVAETAVPTSFIILPYKLSRSEGGKLGMESSDSAPTAVKFAECLINLTDPRSIIYQMDEKSSKYYNVSLYDQVDDEKSLRQEAFSKVKEFEASLLKLYEPGVAYLYLLDEETGVPVVPPKGESKYPIVINEPVNMVRKLMGLMLIGMVQMRGEKAMSVLCTVLADPNITVLPTNWIEAAKELRAHLLHRHCADDERRLEYGHFRNDLSRFISESDLKRKRTTRSVNGSTEWNVELSILKMLLEMHDPNQRYSGLVAQTMESNVLWTVPGQDSPSSSAANTSVSPVEIINLTDVSERDFPILKSASPVLVNQQQRKQDSDEDESKETIEVLHILDSSDDISSYRGRLLSAESPFTSSSSNEGGERASITSKYSMLFEELAVKELPAIPESREPEFETVRMWDAADRVWVDVTSQLNSSGMFWDNQKVIQLKVGLAEQAKKLAFLQKKIASIKDEELRMHQRQQKMYDLLSEYDELWDDQPSTGVVGARRLLVRLCSLEERILCDQIELQHVTIDAFALGEHIRDLSLLPFDEERRDHPPSSACSSPVSSSADWDERDQEKKTDFVDTPADHNDIDGNMNVTDALLKTLEHPMAKFRIAAATSEQKRERSNSSVPSEIDVSPEDLYRDDDLSESTSGHAYGSVVTGRVEI